MDRLKGKTAIITGAASGIGRGIALCFAAQGARVALADLGVVLAQDVIENTGRMIENESIAVKVDVRSNKSVTDMLDLVLEKFGHVDILVNAAGISGRIGKSFDRQSLDDFVDNAHQVLDVNLVGALRTTRGILEHFKKRGEGCIINIASIVAHGRGDMQLKPAYNASKAGLIEFSHWCAIRLAEYSVRVNTISPGLVYTTLWEKLGVQLKEEFPEEFPADMPARAIFDKWVETRVPLKREQTPWDIGMAAVFLASDEAQNITGIDIPVDGGVLAR